MSFLNLRDPSAAGFVHNTSPKRTCCPHTHFFYFLLLPTTASFMEARGEEKEEEEEELADVRHHTEAIEHRRNAQLGDDQRLEECECRKFEETQHNTNYERKVMGHAISFLTVPNISPPDNLSLPDCFYNKNHHRNGEHRSSEHFGSTRAINKWQARDNCREKCGSHGSNSRRLK
jgi:hypothetical protein